MSAIILTFLVVAGVGFFGYYFVLSPLQAKDKQILKLDEEVGDRQAKLLKIKKSQPDLERWKKMSLPANVDRAGDAYFGLLTETLGKANFSNTPTVNSKPPETKTGVPLFANKSPIYKKLAYSIQVKGDEAALVDFLEKFYKMPVLHQIHELIVTRPVTSSAGGGRGNAAVPQEDLDINMTIEALVLDTAEKRNKALPDLKPEEVPPVLATEKREYMTMAGKNLFYGPYRPRQTRDVAQRFDVRQFVHLDGVTGEGKEAIATLYDRYHNEDYRISSRAGFGFQVERFYYLTNRKMPYGRGSQQLSLVADVAGGKEQKWQIAHIGMRDKFNDTDYVILQDDADKKYYKLGMGKSLAHLAEVSKDELDALGLKTAEPAAAAAGEAEKKPGEAENK